MNKGSRKTLFLLNYSTFAAMIERFNNTIGHWVIMVFLAIIWGSSFILMKKGLLVFSFDQVASMRMSFAFVFIGLLGIRFYRLFEWKYALPLFLVGLLGNGIPAFLFTKAETRLDSSIVGVLNSLVPLFVVLIGIIWFRAKVTKAQVLGIVLGLIGAATLMWPEGKLESANYWYYGFFAIAATVCYAISTNLIKSKLQDLRSLAITVIAFSFVGPLALIYLFSTDIIDRMSMPGAYGAMGYVAILGIVGTALAVWLFNELIKMTTAIFAASVTYLIPIVALIWGLIDGEQILIRHFIGIVTILSGVYVVNAKFMRSKKLHAPAA